MTPSAASKVSYSPPTKHHLHPYTTAAAYLPPTLSSCGALVAAASARRQVADDLQVSAVATLDYLGQTVTLMRSDGFRAARPAVLGTVGTVTMEHADQQIDELRQDQLTVLHDQQIRRHRRLS